MPAGVRRQRRGRLTHLKSLDLRELGALPARAPLNRSRRRWIMACAAGENIELRLLDNDGTASAILEAHRSLATDASLRQHLLAGC
jgi:fructose-specific PTS system IIA-like component